MNEGFLKVIGKGKRVKSPPHLSITEILIIEVDQIISVGK